MKYSNILRGLLIAMSVIGMASCSSLNGTVGSYFGMDTDLEVNFVVDADINPDELDKPSPLFIRMYELKTPKMIRKSDFIDIYERDKEVLGADMVAVHKLKRLKPGESRVEHFVLNKDTHYVAFYAEFLKFQDSKYKVVIPVVSNNVIQSSATVHVAGNDLAVDNKSDEDESADYSDTESDVEAGAKDAKGAEAKHKELSGKANELF